MKKSSFINLVLVSSLAVFGGCQKEKKPAPENGDWTVQTDTQNKEEVGGYGRGGISPWLIYYMMYQGSRSYYYGGYDRRGNYSTRTYGNGSAFSIGRNGNRSSGFSSHSVSRGGFGSHGTAGT